MPRDDKIASSEITPRATWLRRRDFLTLGAAGAGALLLGGRSLLAAPKEQHGAKLPSVKQSSFTVDDKKTPFADVTNYNNFYEFGTDKDDPARNAGKLKTRPWTVKVDGECAKPKTFDIDSLISGSNVEERVYRMRCVEAWSMVIPWDGFPLADLLKQVEPTSRAKYVAFETAVQPENMPGVGGFNAIPFPYLEGLRIDEAMHPLTILSLGLYDEVLPNQNGAPVRLVVPWKYGFKSGKSIVKIRFVQTQPKTAWEKAAPQEYGFYSNVNPTVDHPRWSQKREKRLPAFFANHDTAMFNGYGDQVAKLYAGMDLRKFY